MDEDYYKTLNIARGASEAEIQKAYREMARKYHPDLNPDDESAKEKFQQVQRNCREREPAYRRANLLGRKNTSRKSLGK